MDGAVDLLDAAFWIRFGGFGRLFKFPDTFDDNGLLDSIYGGDNTTLALVLASNDLNFIAFLNVGLHRVWVVLLNNPGQYLQHGAPTLLFSRRNVKHNLANVLFF